MGKRKYDYTKIQIDYDDGLSWRELGEKYGITCNSLQKAIKRGEFISRNKSDAAILSHKKTPRSHGESAREKCRIAINKRYDTGWQPKAGRCDKFEYMSPIAGRVFVDGTWEYKYAKYLDTIGVQWQRNTRRFAYWYEGKLRMYIPDFYIVDDDSYTEIKGYTTDKDLAKWSQFPHALTVVGKRELKQLKLI